MTDAENISGAFKRVFDPDLPNELETFGDLFSLLSRTPGIGPSEQSPMGNIFLMGVTRETPLPETIVMKRDNLGDQPVFYVMDDDIPGICFRYLKG